MELHNLKSAPGSRKKRSRIGRGNGSGSGTTAGKGTKGQKCRSGAKIRRGFEGGQMPLYRRIPKRGFTNINRKEYAIVNIRTLGTIFSDGDEVNPAVLKEKNIIKNWKNGLKILGTGDLAFPLHVKAHRFSKTAEAKIRQAGGSVEQLRS